jgi:hypothetical protein
MPTSNWTGSGADNLASTPDNWDTLPLAGYDVVINTGNKAVTWDLTTAINSLTIGASYTGTITQACDMNIGAGGYSQAGGTFTGAGGTTYWINCSGSYIQTAGVVTSDKSRLHFTGDGATFTGTNTRQSYHWFDANITATGLQYTSGGLKVSAGKTVIINNGGRIGSSAGLSNVIDGAVVSIGTGYLLLITYGGANYFPKMNCGSCNVTLNHNNNAAVNIEFLGDTIIKSVSMVGPASYNAVFDLAGHSLTCTSLTVGTRGILLGGEGVITIDGGAFDSSAGTLTEETSTFIFNRNSTVKLAAGQKFYNVIGKAGVRTLLSNVTISNLYAHVNPAILGAFALTLTDPAKEYTGLKRPFIKKRIDIGPVGLTDSWMQDLGALI